jgi:hypothetical protein
VQHTKLEVGWLDDEKVRIEAAHVAHIQNADERLVLARWIQTVLVRYGLWKLFRRADMSDEHKGLTDALASYQNNSFPTVNNFFTQLGGDLSRVSSDTTRSFLLRFTQSFAAIGCPLPLHDEWTLFTGETPSWSLELLKLCDKSKAAGGAAQTVPMQLSTSWNFNVALSFARGGALIALHYRPGGQRPAHHGLEGTEPIRAHLLQELGQYGSFTGKTQECEILLQPGLRVAYEREELVATMPVRDLNRYGCFEKPLLNLRIVHVHLMRPAPVIVDLSAAAPRT